MHILTETLLEVGQRILRLLADGRSHLQGKPAWIVNAADVDIVGLSHGSTVVELEARTLGEAASPLFDTLALWSVQPTREQTVLSLVSEVTRQTIAGNTDSDILDSNVLASIAAFDQVLAHGFNRISFDGPLPSDRAAIARDDIGKVTRLRTFTPLAERTIVAGWLDELAHSKRAFTLRIADGQVVRGLLPESDDLRPYASLWGTRVAVDGEATFRPSGAVSVLAASSIRPASAADAIWERTPHATPRNIEELLPHHATTHGTNAFGRLYGRWPGQETDEEIEAALLEMS